MNGGIMMKSPRSRLAILILAAAVIFSSGISALAEEKAHERRIRLSAELIREMNEQNE